MALFDELVSAEMESQDRKWGADRHLDDHVWLAALGEEVGECCSACLTDDQDRKGDLNVELVQVAALCQQWIKDMESSHRPEAHDTGDKFHWLSAKINQPDDGDTERAAFREFCAEFGQVAMRLDPEFNPDGEYADIGNVLRRLTLVCRLWYGHLVKEALGQ